MAATKCEHVACIDEGASFFVDRFFEGFRSKTGDAWKISEHLRTFRVYPFHERIVMRYRWRSFDCKVGEAFGVTELQEFVEFPFVTDGAAQARSNVCAARRASAVIRINDHVIGKFKIEIVERVELLCGELPGVFLA